MLRPAVGLSLLLLACSGIPCLAPSAPLSPPPVTQVVPIEAPSPTPAQQPVGAPALGSPDSPTIAELEGTWTRVFEHGGREVIYTSMCAAEVPHIDVSPRSITVHSGQESVSSEVTAITSDADKLTLSVSREYVEPSTLTVRRASGVWVWEGPEVDGGTWRTAIKVDAFPQKKQCCASSEEDPVEIEYAVVDANADCPPEP